MPQVLAEHAAMNVLKLLYVSKSFTSCVVLETTFDPILWEKIYNIIQQVYLKRIEDVKMPTPLPVELKDIKTHIMEYCKNNVKFICEVPTIKVGSPTKKSSGDQIAELTKLATELIKDTHELSRKKSSELFVWVINDTDRLWSREKTYASPVAWAMTTPTFNNKILRSMHGDLLDKCLENDIHVACSSFDGAHFNLSQRSSEGEPLTELQLSLDVWKQICSMSRQNLCALLSDVQLPAELSIKKKQHKSGLLFAATKKWSLEKEKWDKDEFVITVSCLSLKKMNDTLYSKESETSVDPETLQNEEILVDITSTHQYSLNGAQAKKITVALKTHKNDKIRTKWESKTENCVSEFLQNAEILNKELTVPEINEIIKNTKEQQKDAGITIYVSDMSKAEKVNALIKIFGDQSSVNVPDREKKLDQVYSLKEMAKTVLAKRFNTKKCSSKHTLNVVSATVVYPHALEEWKTTATVAQDVYVYDAEGFMWKPEHWFAFPEFNMKRKMLEPNVWDSHHLLVNLRVKVCKDGLPGFGISNEAWFFVAANYPHIISKCLVNHLIDKQSNAFAKRTFSIDVENVMRKHDFNEEANFCRLVRTWSVLSYFSAVFMLYFCLVSIMFYSEKSNVT